MANFNHAESPSPFDKVWDVLIVGAGPAGLFAALGVASASDLDVFVIEAGADIAERQREVLQNWESVDQRSNYVTGVGGAGLYSDGKLCFSLEVGGQLKNNLTAGKKDQLLRAIAEHFGLLDEFEKMWVARGEQVAAAKERAAAAGLDFKYYPVLSIGTERCRDLIVELRGKLLRAGATILTRCELRGMRQAGGVKEAAIEYGGEAGMIKARKVVLALGKVGASFEAKVCQELVVRVGREPMYVGVRLETDTEALQPLFALSKDPKYSLRFPDGSKVKTHCASQDGQVLALVYEGLPIAGGHNFHQIKTGRSGFSVLWDGIRLRRSPYEEAKEIMSAIGAYTGGTLLIQTLSDYRAGVPSTELSLRGISPSNPVYKPGDIRRFLPGGYFEKFDEFLGRLGELAPRIFDAQTVLYAPAIEWWMNRIEVNGYMETTCKGLYVCGDGSGWSQGIIHSAATGLLVAEGITGENITRGEDDRPLSATI